MAKLKCQRISHEVKTKQYKGEDWFGLDLSLVYDLKLFVFCLHHGQLASNRTNPIIFGDLVHFCIKYRIAPITSLSKFYTTCDNCKMPHCQKDQKPSF